MQRVSPLRRLKATRVALVQDEFYRPYLYCRFIKYMGLHGVFSVAPEAEWEKIYAGVDLRACKFEHVLTGYIDEEKVKQMRGIIQSDGPRPIDIGYRTAGRPYFWFGRHGYLKQWIAEKVADIGPGLGLKLDITTRDGDTILGDDWYRFLGRCRYTIGVESGTSITRWPGKAAVYRVLFAPEAGPYVVAKDGVEHRPDVGGRGAGIAARRRRDDALNHHHHQTGVQAVAGYVADSDPAAEQQECVNKAKALFRAAEEAKRFANAGRRGQYSSRTR